jgi:uncharacterized protein YciI
VILQHFIIELTYTVPFEQFGDALPAHRAFLTAAYEQHWILVSGPQVPRTGGVIIARAPSLEALKLYMADDPFSKRGLATYRYIEFDPVRYQPLLGEWVTG